MTSAAIRRITGALGIAVAVAAQVHAVVSVNSSARTATTPNLFVDWSNHRTTNPEEISILKWSNVPAPGGPTGPTLTEPAFTSGCIPFEEHFGNSWAGGSPQTGDAVFVGAGSTGTWSVGPGKKVVINSVSTLNGCPSNAFNPAGVPIATEYQFWDNPAERTAAGPWQRVRVTRQFEFENVFTSDLRPYIPRMRVDVFSEVVYPTADGVVTVSVFGYPFGDVAPDWDAGAGWFAMHSAATGAGLLVKRLSTNAAQLWLDWDAGDSATNSSNASSIMLVAPGGGFTGSVVEEEFLCFYNPDTWPDSARQAGLLPQACGGD